MDKVVHIDCPSGILRKRVPRSNYINYKLYHAGHKYLRGEKKKNKNQDEAQQVKEKKYSGNIL